MRLPGWTRGLYFRDNLAFVGTSRVIPKYRHYAPGLDPDHCETGGHAVDLATGRVVGSLTWTTGNQIFAIEGLDRALSPGVPFASRGRGERRRNVTLFGCGLVAWPAGSNPRHGGRA